MSTLNMIILIIHNKINLELESQSVSVSTTIMARMETSYLQSIYCIYKYYCSTFPSSGPGWGRSFPPPPPHKILDKNG